MRMIDRNTYIDEVCTTLLDDTEHKYLRARTDLEHITMASDLPEEEQTHLIDAARKENLSASKEYLTIAFKTKFLGVELE